MENNANGNNNNNSNRILVGVDKHDDDYYIDIDSEPPRFALYRHVRVENCSDEWRKKTCECVWDTITQDELDYYLKKKLRRSTPEERYQSEKKEWFSHELSYLHQTVVYDDPNYPHGKAVDIIKEYGCERGWVDSKPENEEGGYCVPECRYYRKYGRIEDEEVIERHNKWVESYRQKNAIIEPTSYSELLELINSESLSWLKNCS